MKCQQCGRDINDNAKFCKYCGNPVMEHLEEPKANEAVRICTKCGKQMRNDNLFCTNCGTALAGASTPKSNHVTKKTKKKKGITLFLVVSVFIIFGCCAATAIYFFGDEIKVLLEDSFEKNNEQDTTKKNDEIEEIDMNSEEDSNQNIISNEDVTENIESTETVVSPVKSISEANTIDITASSSLSEYQMIHSANRTMDGDLSTAWVEGVEGHGVGEQISFVFDGEYEVNGFNINAGYQKNNDLYKKNSRPEEVYIKFSDGSGAKISLEDINGVQDVKFGSGIVTESITITINSVYEGNKYEDTVISEISFY